MTAEQPVDCLLCRDAAGLSEAGHSLLAAAEHWRIIALGVAAAPTVVLATARHTDYLWGLDDGEALTLGPMLRWSTDVLRRAADADLVLTCAFGKQLSHCHLALVAYRPGDPIVGLEGNFVAGAPPVDPARLAHIHKRIRESRPPTIPSLIAG
jgi:diadenosine tetraphosphate (Ap4A) HIT family hydrolase